MLKSATNTLKRGQPLQALFLLSEIYNNAISPSVSYYERAAEIDYIIVSENDSNGVHNKTPLIQYAKSITITSSEPRKVTYNSCRCSYYSTWKRARVTGEHDAIHDNRNTFLRTRIFECCPYVH